MEEWRIIEGFSYEISSFGRVKNIKTDKILKNRKGKTGYYSVNLYRDKKAFTRYVHRLVLLTFSDCKGETVNHIDGNKSNNNLNNLEWLSNGDNTRHAIELGLIKKKGEECNLSKLKNEQVLEIVNLLKRGLSQRYIASIFNVNESLISMIKTGKRWKWLTKF